MDLLQFNNEGIYLHLKESQIAPREEAGYDE